MLSRASQVVQNLRHPTAASAISDVRAGMLPASLLGNFTFGASLVVYSTEGTYLHHQMPWIVGSIGPMGLDFVLLVQVSCYGRRHHKSARGRILPGTDLVLPLMGSDIFDSKDSGQDI